MIRLTEVRVKWDPSPLRIDRGEVTTLLTRKSYKRTGSSGSIIYYLSPVMDWNRLTVVSSNIYLRVNILHYVSLNTLRIGQKRFPS